MDAKREILRDLGYSELKINNYLDCLKYHGNGLSERRLLRMVNDLFKYVDHLQAELDSLR